MKFWDALVLAAVASYGASRVLPVHEWGDEDNWPRATWPLQVATAAGVALVTGGVAVGPVVTVGPIGSWWPLGAAACADWSCGPRRRS